MKIIAPCVELVNPVDAQTLYATIEKAGRVCYKSEDKITEGSSEKFIRGILKSGHEAVIEHGVITVKITTDRGVSHEIVRHRLASYCQESTRYCNYSKGKYDGEITVIRPSTIKFGSYEYSLWEQAMASCEKVYMLMIDAGMTAQQARAVLPNSLKTEVVMTANVREWRHFLKLRTAPAAHPDMQEVACMVRKLLTDKYPVLFEDLYMEGEEK